MDRTRRLLLKQGKPISLNPKTFDLLLTLVENRGDVLTKDELLERVWAGHFVEEGNLKVQISTLRKVFGERSNDHRFIVTVPGRGYSFVADVDDTGSEIVVESHSVSRIVISEEKDAPETSETQLGGAHRRSYLLPSLAGLLVLTAIAGGYMFLRSSRQQVRASTFADLRIKRLTTNGRVSFAALSPDGRLFVYALKELEQNSLWLGFVNGGDDVLLRPSETGRYNGLAFSSDGNSVLFTFSGADSRQSVLYRMPVPGGPREEVRSGVGSFSVSPDAKRYAFASHDPATKINKLVVARFDDNSDTSILLPTLKSVGSESISWSPNGNEIAIGAAAADGAGGEEVFLVDVATGSTRQVTKNVWKEVIKTAWIAGGEGLLLVAEEKDSHTSVSYSQIWQVTLADGEVRQVTRDLSSYRSVLDASTNGFLSVELRQMNNIWVAPSADLGRAKQVTFGTFGKYDGLWGLDWTAGGNLIFTSTDHQSQVISEMNADGTNIRQLTPPGTNDSMLNASSDGKYIVFESTRGGGSNIWRMNSDGGALVRLTAHGDSHQPFISPDGRYVYYIRSRESGGGLHRVSIEGGEGEKLIDGLVSYPSVSADGMRIAASIGTRLVIFPVDGKTPTREFELTRFGTPSGNTRWSPDGRSIAYRDRGYGYWLQPLDGAEPQRIEDLPKEKFYNFAWSKDGKQFALVRGQEIRDVVLLQSEP